MKILTGERSSRLRHFDGIKRSPEDIVIVKLIRYINENNLREGDKLPSIREFSTLWEMGQSQIRSGMIKASALGVISMESRSGSYVREFDFSEVISIFALLFEESFSKYHPRLLDLYDLKTVLECGIVKKAVKVVTPEDLYQAEAPYYCHGKCKGERRENSSR